MSGARVLIVGCGRMGSVRAAAARRFGASVTAVLDASPEAAAALSSRHPGSRVVDRVEDIDWAEFDAAFVCTPPGSRGVELDAVRARVPVLVEKPLSVCAADGRELVEAAKRYGTRTAVGYMNRHRPGVKALRRRLDQTPAFAVTCHWVAGRYDKPWWDDPAKSGGPLNDLASHLVDLCRFLAGEVESVWAFERESARADVVAVGLRFRSGACGTLLHSFMASEKHIALEAFTTNWSARLEDWEFRPPGEASTADRDRIFVEETASFLGGGPVLSDVADAWRTQLVIDAIKRATETGAPVEVKA
jgi:predicted dehydrogenase